MMWCNEPYKIVLTFDNGKTYEVESNHAENDKFITYAHRRCDEQVNYNNLFGSISSKSFEFTVFDLNNYLDIENVNSPYYNYMRNGVKVNVFISHDEKETWDKFGTYYVTDWSNMWNNGIHDVVTIKSHDEMRYLLNNDVPKLSTYSGIKADELIYRVLTGCGVDKNRIKIDKSLNTELRFGLAEDEKVGYFLNEICQALCAVIYINDNDDILVMPALVGYNKQYEVDGSCIESVNSNNNNKNIYTNVKCRYNKMKGKHNGSVLYDTVELEQGNNKLKNLRLNVKALNIREIRVETEENIDIRSFSAYQNGIDIEIISDLAIEETDVTVSGEYINSVEKFVTSDINFSDQKINRSVSYEMYNQYVQNEEDAQIISNKMARYIEVNNKKIVLVTILNPCITVGDIILTNQNSLNGKYKIIADDTVLTGTDYKKVLTVIPCSTVGIWDDSKSWNDDANWLENLSLSLS